MTAPVLIAHFLRIGEFRRGQTTLRKMGSSGARAEAYHRVVPAYNRLPAPMKLDVLDKSATEAPWYAEGLTFTCTQCGNCCTGAPGYVWISEVEIERLASHLMLPRDQVIERYCRRIGERYSLKERRSPQGLYDCIFLEEVKVPAGRGAIAHTRRVCSIYPVRPLQCRTWPFWDGLLTSKEAWDSAGQRCHGINQGSRQFSREQIEALRTAKDWPDNPPTSKSR